MAMIDDDIFFLYFCCLFAVILIARRYKATFVWKNSPRCPARPL